MTNTLTFLHLGEEENPLRYIHPVLRWIVDAEEPFASWFYQGRLAAEVAVEERLRRTSSELWIGGITQMLCGDQHVGGFVAMRGNMLRKCGALDILNYVQRLPSNHRVRAIEQIRRSFAPFPPVEDDVFFLSRLGMDPSFRGRGLSLHLVERFKADAMRARASCCQLNVFAENLPAVGLYHKAGFQTHCDFWLGDGAFRYLCLRLEL